MSRQSAKRSNDRLNQHFKNMKRSFVLLMGVLLLASCEHRHNLYQARARDTKCYGCKSGLVEVASEESYSVGDTVIVDETNFVDMNDENGTQYIIVKPLGTIPIEK